MQSLSSEKRTQKRGHADDDQTGEPLARDGETSISETAPMVIPSEKDNFVAKVIQTLYWRLLPFTTLLIICCYIDRGNAGYVAGDLCRELHLTDSDYGLGVSVFGIGYITSQIPSNYVLRKLGASTWFAVLLITWGAVASCFSFVKNKVQFYILRVLLGIAEGGTFPGVWYLLSIFFPPDYLTFPNSTIETSISISSILASPLAAFCLTLGNTFDVTGWRLLFFLEGVLPVLYGIFLFFTLPSTPEHAFYLSPEQKRWLRSHQPQEPEHHLIRELGTVFRTRPFYVLGANAFVRGTLISLSTNWTTLIISQITHGDSEKHHCGNTPTDINSVLLTAVPFTIAAVLSLWVGHKATNSKRRPLLSGSMMICAALFLFGFVLFEENFPLVALIFLGFTYASFLAPNCILVSLTNAYFYEDARATGIACFNTLLGVGMIIGPLLIGYLVEYQGYAITVAVLAILSFCTGSCLFLLKDPSIQTGFHSADAA